MRLVAALLTLTIDLGGIFGLASAVGREVSASLIEVDLTVEAPTGEAVAAHLLDPSGREQTLALAERLPGVYGSFFETTRVDLTVVFEVVGPPSVQSRPVTLTELGLDPALLGRLATAPGSGEGGLSKQAQLWGWAAVALGAGALAVLALWALPERRARRAKALEHSEGEADEDGGSPVETAEPQSAAGEDDQAGEGPPPPGA